MIHELSLGWHPGEVAVHKLLNRGLEMENPTSVGLPWPYAYRVVASPLVAFGALDRQGQPWTTIWGGERQFVRPVADNLLQVQTLVDLDHDPVVDALFGGDNGTDSKGDGELLSPGPDDGPVMAGLSIDLETRNRVKLAGRMLGGAALAHPKDANSDEELGVGRVGGVQLVMLVKETLGNCPKYLNKKAIRPHVPQPRLLHDSDTLPLPQAAIDVIARADLFFLSTTDGSTMDTNHRGGPRGFLRLANNGGCSAEGGQAKTELVYPEFSGNRLYQSLGNLHVKPLIGLVVPDFETGSVLYLTGRTKTLVGAEAAAYMPHTKLAIHITVSRAILVADGLPFRGSFIDYSPYNPPVRKLKSEIVADGSSAAADADAKKPFGNAVLTGRQELTPYISRFSFVLQPLKNIRDLTDSLWLAGQYVTLDFGPELDVGWSHMRDNDPQSLNDDFIRTFTISSPPLSAAAIADAEKGGGIVFDMALRRHGPVTDFLWRHNPRVPLEIPVLGFGGEESFRISLGGEPRESIFVAAGVGITPMLAQAPGLIAAARQGAALEWKVLWSLRAADLSLATESFKRIEGLAEHTNLFVTSSVDTTAAAAIQQLKEMGASAIEGRRMQKDDIVFDGSKEAAARRTIHICTGAELLRDIQTWLPGENLVWESFSY